jgi:hypothetical protein
MNWNKHTWPSLGIPFADEQQAAAWEALPQQEKDAAIAKRIANSVHWGRCQRCHFRIEATGAAWPTSCPECGYESELSD